MNLPSIPRLAENLCLSVALLSGASCSSTYQVCVQVEDGANDNYPTELLLIWPSADLTQEWTDVEDLDQAKKKLKDLALSSDSYAAALLGEFQPSSDASKKFEKVDINEANLKFSKGLFSGPTVLLVYSNFKGTGRVDKLLKGAQPYKKAVYIKIDETELLVSFPPDQTCNIGN